MTGGVDLRCPDDSDLAAFAEGRLGPGKRPSVVAHVEGCTACADLVAFAAGHETASVEASDRVEYGRGSSFGRYLIERHVGSGGLGDVYAAYDPQLDRRVALKVVRPSALAMDDESEQHRRLLREARALAKVTHANVVAVHDVGTQNEAVFIAMEFVEGLTLRDTLREPDRGWPELRPLFVAAARGLAAAHRAGLVHRDFKPGNVMVNTAGEVKVLDFGLARLVGPPAARRQQLNTSPCAETTASEQLIAGTPAYMAPEQLKGAPISATADQFAFCVVLFEALHRVRPFAGGSLEERHHAIVEQRFAPSEATSSVPSWLDAVLRRGLRADPNERYEDMEAVIEALYLDDRVHSRRRALFVGSALLASLTSAAVGWAWVRPPAQDDVVQGLTRAAYAAAAKNNFVYPSRDNPAVPTAYTLVLELEGLDGPSRSDAMERGDALRAEFARTLTGIGDGYWDRVGGRPFAMEYYAQAMVFAGDDFGRLSRAAMTVPQVIDLRQRASDVSFTDAELATGDVLAALARSEEHSDRAALVGLAQRIATTAPRTAANLERMLGPANASTEPGDEKPPGLAQRPEVGAPHDMARDTSAPVKTPQRKHRAAVGRSGPVAPNLPEPPSEPPAMARDPERAVLLVRRGLQQLERGDEATAIQTFHQALDADPRSAAANAGLAEVHFQLGKYSTAVQKAERAVRLAPRNGQYNLRLADFYFRVARYKAARQYYGKAAGQGHAVRAREGLDRIDALVGAG